MQLPHFPVVFPALTSSRHLRVTADGVPITVGAPQLPFLLTMTLDGESPMLLDLPALTSLQQLQVTETGASSELVAELEALLP